MRHMQVDLAGPQSLTLGMDQGIKRASWLYVLFGLPNCLAPIEPGLAGAGDMGEEDKGLPEPLTALIYSDTSQERSP